MATTQKLGIPLLEGNMIVARTGINNALKKIDQEALPQAHALSGGHWKVWEKGKAYVVGDIIRTDDIYSWGYLQCTTAGVSGSVVPVCPYGQEDTVTDGTAVWTLKSLSGQKQHKDLIGRALPDQHPIAAITGLREELDDRATKEAVSEGLAATETVCKEYTDEKIEALIAGAPEALDTLKELADAMKDESDALAAMTAAIGNKVDKVAGKGLSTNDFDNAAKGKVDHITVNQDVNLDTLQAQSHTHGNKALLDTYTQTEANLADAVAKKHGHANKAVLDKLSDENGKVFYDGKVLATKKDIIKYAIVL